MSLTQTQINQILKQYDTKQFKARSELDARTKEIYIKIPQMRQLDDELISGSAEYAKLLLTGKKINTDELKKKNQDISNKKIQLLLDAGYPEDYLTMKYECSACSDTGFIDNKPCSCYKRATISLLYSEALINNAIFSQNFSTFDYSLYSDTKKDPVYNITPLENINCVVKICKTFIKELDIDYNKRENKNLLITGSTGVGKTFLSNCIAKEALDNAHSVVYITAGELFTILENIAFNRDYDNDVTDARLENIEKCDILIIDDLGTEFTSRFTTSKLYTCINNRILKNLPTVISTNLNFKDIKETYGERICSRIIGEFTTIKILGDDIRIKKS